MVYPLYGLQVGDHICLKGYEKSDSRVVSVIENIDVSNNKIFIRNDFANGRLGYTLLAKDINRMFVKCEKL